MGGATPPAANIGMGNGIAAQGLQTVASMPYMRYVQEMKAQGLEPLPPAQWAAQNAAGPQGGPQGMPPQQPQLPPQ